MKRQTDGGFQRGMVVEPESYRQSELALVYGAATPALRQVLGKPEAGLEMANASVSWLGLR